MEERCHGRNMDHTSAHTRIHSPLKPCTKTRTPSPGLQEEDEENEEEELPPIAVSISIVAFLLEERGGSDGFPSLLSLPGRCSQGWQPFGEPDQEAFSLFLPLFLCTVMPCLGRWCVKCWEVTKVPVCE